MVITMSKLIFLICILFLISGCDYIPHDQFEIKTESGEIIKISCPVVDKYRNRITYLTDGECIIVK